MKDNPGTVLFTQTPEQYDTIIAFAKRSKWLIVGLEKNKTTYLTQSGNLVVIQRKGIKCG